ncbi:MAG: class II aldolase/adducin family protein [Ktedonobacteraceae bacterium]
MSTHISLDSLKAQLLQAVNLLEKAQVMSHSGHGNMSVHIPGTEHLLLASTSKFEQLTTEQMAVVTFAGEVVEGSLSPVAREIVGMHSCVYRLRGVGAVIHTHSPHVTSFALAHKPLPCAYEALLRFGVTEDIPVAAWAPRGSQESVSNIIEQLRLHPLAPAVLLANHGLLAFGRDPIAAAQVVISMEEAAEYTLEARVLGGEQSFPDGALEQERRHMQQFGSV